jgi:competence protein ComGC
MNLIILTINNLFLLLEPNIISEIQRSTHIHTKDLQLESYALDHDAQSPYIFLRLSLWQLPYLI